MNSMRGIICSTLPLQLGAPQLHVSCSSPLNLRSQHMITSGPHAHACHRKRDHIHRMHCWLQP